ncbi:MAG: hypothetical protein M1327_04935 [Candidatus Thermoplasmatota archaeon]|nr:hypothetical protein [Candidatus Thermoplasmatota archaeon]
MRIIVFILVMLITAFLPVHSYGQTGSQAQQTGTYYFSNNPSGSPPVNSSLFSFSTIGNNSTVSSATGKGTNGTGLQLSTCNSKGASYLEIRANATYHDFSLLLSFSWNDTRNFGSTEDNVALLSGSTTFVNLSFGPDYGYKLIENRNSSSNGISQDPSENTLCNLSISYSAGSGSTYFSFTSNAGKTAMPLIYPTSSLDNENLKLILGGSISSFTLYSIGISNISSVSAIPIGLNVATPSKAVIQTNPFGSLYYNYTWFDPTLNTLIGITGANKIAAYNLENSSSYYLYTGTALRGNLTIIAENSPTAVIYLASNLSAAIVFTITKSNLSINAAFIDTSLNMYGSMLGQNGSYVLAGNNGAIAYIEHGALRSSFMISSLQRALLLNADIKGLNLSAEWLLNNTIIGTSINVLNSTFSLDSETNLSSIPSGYILAKTFSNLGNISSILLYGDNTTLLYISPAGNFGLDIGADKDMAIGGISANAFSMDVEGNLFLKSGQTIYPFQGLNASGYMPVAFSSFGIILLSSSSMVIYYNSSHLLVTGGSPTADVNSTYVVRETANIDFNIQSTSQFYALLSFSNTTLKSGSSYFTFNTTSTADGSYSAYLNISNIQGFTASYALTLDVDNGNPNLSLSIANNSYVPQNFDLRLNYSFWVQVSHIGISYGGSNISLLPENQTIQVSFGNLTGKQEIRLDMVDELGISHIYVLYVNVISNGTSGFAINLQNGTYLNSTHYLLTWSTAPYVKEYIIKIIGMGTSDTTSTKATSANISLVNGNLTITLTAIQLDGDSLLLAERMITVVAYSPALMLSGNSSGYYSFYGNSSNNTFIMEAQSNSSAYLSLYVAAQNGDTIFSASGQDHLTFSTANNTRIFAVNGIYEIHINAKGPSGLTSNATITLNVNNTDPKPLYRSGSHIYTNSSTIDIGQGQLSGVNYLYTVYFGGQEVEQSTAGIFTLLNGTGNYSLSVYEVNIWSDHTTLDEMISYQTTPPAINISQDGVNSQYIRYSIDDAVPLKTLLLHYLNYTIPLNASVKSGIFYLDINENTKINVSLYVVDACENSAAAEAGFQITDFINITSSSLNVFSIFGFGYFQLVLKGQNTANASVIIRTNSGSSNGHLFVDYFLPFGYSSVAAVISYNGHNITLERTVFSISWYPLFAALGVVVVILALKTAGQTSDPEKIEELVLGYVNHSMKEIRRKSTKWKVRKKALKATIDAMTKKGVIKIEEDPDGEAYVMLQENA